MQIDIWTGQGYCVTEEGKKIRGSDFMGNRDCTKGDFKHNYYKSRGEYENSCLLNTT